MPVITGQGLVGRINSVSANASRVLLIGGKPLNEPIARYGPFVMNSNEQIFEAAKTIGGPNAMLGPVNAQSVTLSGGKKSIGGVRGDVEDPPLELHRASADDLDRIVTAGWASRNSAGSWGSRARSS